MIVSLFIRNIPMIEAPAETTRFKIQMWNGAHTDISTMIY